MGEWALASSPLVLPAPSAAVAGTESALPLFSSPSSSAVVFCVQGTWTLSPEARGLTKVFPGLGQAVQGGSGGPDQRLVPATELCVNILSFRCST